MTTAINAERLDPNMAPAPDGEGSELAWLSPREAPFAITGLCWLARDRVYRRLPVEPDWPLPPAVDSLAGATAGGQIRFRTDSTTVAVRVRLAGPANMNHMPATGQCGIDAYVGDVGDQQYWGTARPVLGEVEYAAVVFRTGESAMRSVTLNLPLYQGVVEVRVGVDADATLEPHPPYGGDRVVIYGTSITQGGCASRPGMAYPAILGRRIDREFVNLGFSGNGKGEPEVARTIAQIDDVACFVLDYEANSGPLETYRETLAGFIPILRERHPDTPILVVSKAAFVRERRDPAYAAERVERRDAQAAIVAGLRAAGDDRVHFLDMGGVDVADGSVDGVHPTDLGFVQLADAIEPELRRLLD